MRSLLAALVLVIFSILLTAIGIYETPLRYTSLIQPPPIHDVDPKEFYAEYTAHKDAYLFIDVRQATAYEASHAPGSVNIPLQNLYTERLNLPRSGKIIALICSTGEASGVAYEYLQHYGFTNIIRITGGVQNWAAEGLPLEGTQALPATSSSTALAVLPCNA